MHRRERNERVSDVILGKDGHRPLDGELAIEQRLRDGANRPQRLGVGDAPPALLRAFGEKDRIRCLAAPIFEHVAEIATIRIEPLWRAQDHAAVGKTPWSTPIRSNARSAKRSASSTSAD